MENKEVFELAGLTVEIRRSIDDQLSMERRILNDAYELRLSYEMSPCPEVFKTEILRETMSYALTFGEDGRF